MPTQTVRTRTRQGTRPGRSAAAGDSFSHARLARMHDALRRHVESGYVPGLAAMVYCGGREHVETIGTTGFGNAIAVRRDTLFRLASTTKPITAAGAMVLVEECRMRLDDPVDEWLPELRDRRVLRSVDSEMDDTVPARRRISIRDLLTFRSGYGELGFLAPTAPFQRELSAAGLSLAEWPFAGTSDEFMKRLGGLPLAHQPGERWLYHTSGEVLGVLIARVSGTSLGAFLAERIFEPLGMKDTGFSVPSARLDRLPPCYGRDMLTGELLALYDAGGGYAANEAGFQSGAGGLVSTLDDLLAFGRMMLPDDPQVPRVLSRPSIDLMTTDQLTAEQKDRSPFFENFWATYGWGLGMGVVTTRHDIASAPGRFGWDGAFGTSWYVDPNEGLVGILMVQRRPDQLSLPALTSDFWTSAYQLIER